MRQRGFESHPVLCRLIFNNSARNSRTHDVAAAYRLAKAEVRVQLPLGAFSFAWTVRRENEGPLAMNDYQRVGKHGNPRASGARERRFKSDHADWKTLRWSPCWYGQAAVNRRDTGSIPVAAAS